MMRLLEHTDTPGHLCSSSMCCFSLFPTVRERASRLFKSHPFGSSPSKSNPKKPGGVIDKELKLPGPAKCLILIVGLNAYEEMVTQGTCYNRKVSSKAQDIKMHKIKAIFGRSHLKLTIL